MQFHTAAMVAFLVAGVLLLAATSTRAAPSYESERLPNIDDYVLQMLRKSYELENVKRGLDLGFDRGYSGTKAAKYLTGLELAGPMGPGRKRRSDENGFNNQLATYMAAENSKRGLDLGFGRGFSGMQAARHLIGLEEANDARGPGRRRRSAVSSDITADEAS